MRIAIDLSGYSTSPGFSTFRRKDPGKLKGNEKIFIDQSLDYLSTAYPKEELIRIPALERKGLNRLLSTERNKARQLMQIKPAVVLTDFPFKKKLPGINLIWFVSEGQMANPHLSVIAENADAIVITSDFQKSVLEKAKIPSQKISLVYGAPEKKELQLDWQQKNVLKQEYSEGKEFFLARVDIGPDTGWESLFKAFSTFKKWQQTEVQLLISAEMDEDYQSEFEKKLESYKYRNDVKFLDEDKNYLDVLPAAYGLILYRKDVTGMDILNSFASGVPVIASGENLFHASLADCYLLAGKNADELSKQIVNLYRDEHLRDMLAERGKAAIAHFSWEFTAKNWYDLISTFASQSNL